MSTPVPDNRTPALFWQLVAISVVVALVPTFWPQLDVAAAALFSGTAPVVSSKAWWWVEIINQWVPAAFRVLLMVCAAGWLLAHLTPRWKAWRLPLAFVVCAGIAGPGAIVNWGFKDQWQRARPYQVENFGGPQTFTRATVMTDQCTSNCSFVSGHVACGFFFSSLLLVATRRKKLWIAVGSASGAIVGFARMSDMAHWFSDVLWAYPITLMSSWLVWQLLRRLYGTQGAEINPTATSA